MMTYKKQWEHGFKALYWGVTLYKTTEIANRIEFTNHSSETWPNVHTIILTSVILVIFNTI